jgi:hypothetical protein
MKLENNLKDYTENATHNSVSILLNLHFYLNCQLELRQIG